MEHYQLEYLVIGAGVVGLAVARALAVRGKEVWLVEQESDIGTQTSSRNSEVIHAGIYYPKGSLKAALCVRGKQLLYDYCEQHKIPYRRCGKLIVARDQRQIATLHGIREQARGNLVEDLTWLDQRALLTMEPELEALAALHSPSTGIIDSHALMQQFKADIEQHGGQLVLNTELTPVGIHDEGVEFRLGHEDVRLTATCCVNAAGLNAIALFQNLAAFPKACLPTAYFAKGSYFSYRGKVPFSHLVYPVPEPGGLGVHLTLDMAGMAKFGPDVEWLNGSGQQFDYQVDPEKLSAFASAVAHYWPGLDPARLVPDYSGIRPKITGPGHAAGDFLIQVPQQHGIPGLVNLFGIESPGLTSSMAIAEHVCLNYYR